MSAKSGLIAPNSRNMMVKKMPIIDDDAEVIVTEDTDHIQDWIEEHGGKPAMTDEVGSVDIELGIDFEDEDEDENLEPISWEDFFLILDEKDLAFAYVTDEEGYSLNSQKFDFVERKGADTEMEEQEVFDNTLETPDEENPDES